MTESKLTKQIKRSLFDFIRKNRSYGLFVAYEVSILSNWFDHAKGNRSERCDVVSWDGNEHFVCYEIKITYEDFLSGNHISMFGDRNYLVVPSKELAERIVKSREFDWRFGILVYDEANNTFRVYRRTTVQKAIKLADKQLVMEGFAKACARDFNKGLKNGIVQL